MLTILETKDAGVASALHKPKARFVSVTIPNPLRAQSNY
jgi:hypothetical protein